MRGAFSWDSVIDSILSSAAFVVRIRETADLRDSSAPRITLVISTIQDRAPATMQDCYMTSTDSATTMHKLDSTTERSMRDVHKRLMNKMQTQKVEEMRTADCPVDLLGSQNGLQMGMLLYD